MRADIAGPAGHQDSLHKSLRAAAATAAGLDEDATLDALEAAIADARKQAIEELQAEAASLGGNAVVGIDLDYEVIGDRGSMLMVSASGTAVRV